MAQTICLDHHFSTRPCAPALERFRASLEGPLEPSIQMIYDLVGAAKEDTFAFTSSGAEAIQQVHWTAFTEIARKEGKCHFVCCEVEDAPMMQSLKRLEELGCYVKMAPLASDGQIDLEKLAELLNPRTAMISISLAHSLTGVIQPIEAIAELARQKGVLLHVDATYALGKTICPFHAIDYLTFAGGPLHAMPCSGAIFAKASKPLSPFIFSKTVDVPSLSALCAASSQASLSMDLMSLEVARLRDRLESSLPATPLFTDSLRLPNVSVLLFPHIHQEMLHYMLSRKQLSSSLGGQYAPHLHRHLAAAHLPEQTALTALSFSLSRFTTEEEIDKAIAIIQQTVSALRPLTEDLV